MSDVRTLYTSGSQTWKVWALLVFSVPCAMAAVWFGADLARTYGLSPADGGVLKPLPVRLAWAVGLSALGLGLLGGMVMYGFHYLTRLDLDAETGVLHLRPLLGRPRRVPLAEVGGATFHEGRSEGRITVNAPWLSVRVPGRRLGYVVDLQGDIPDPGALTRALDGRRAART